VSGLLAKVFQRKGMKRAIRRAEVVLMWPQIAGPDLAQFTKGRSLKDGILYVDVPDSETAMHLSLQRERFLEAYRNRFNVHEIRDLRFRPGRGALQDLAEEQQPDTSEVAVDPMALHQLAQRLDKLNLPKELTGPAMQAARSMLTHRTRREAEGWTPCFLCDSLAKTPGMCDTCQRYAGQVRVKRASRTLTVYPDAPVPELSSEECTVARYLARTTLLEQLNELLPQALTDPSIRTHLEMAARCFLALQLDKPLAEISTDDFNQLPLRLAQVFGQ
jgi:hypothetical protein